MLGVSEQLTSVEVARESSRRGQEALAFPSESGGQELG